MIIGSFAYDKPLRENKLFETVLQNEIVLFTHVYY